MAKSKAASGRPVASASPSMKAMSARCFSASLRAVASCSGDMSIPVTCGAAPRHPGGDIARAAPQLDGAHGRHVFGKQPERRFRRPPVPPFGRLRRPEALAGCDPVRRVGVPDGLVDGDVVVRHPLILRRLQGPLTAMCAFPEPGGGGQHGQRENTVEIAEAFPDPAWTQFAPARGRRSPRRQRGDGPDRLNSADAGSDRQMHTQCRRRKSGDYGARRRESRRPAQPSAPPRPDGTSGRRVDASARAGTRRDALPC
jgi:hypothetical protein